MKIEGAWRRYLRFWGASPEGDVDDEFRFHLETKTEELRARGFSKEEARREALRQFGPIPQPRAECVAVSRGMDRRRSRTEYFREWFGDLRYAWRVLRKAKASTATAVVILAVGIGGATAVFTLLDRMIYEPLPVWRPAELALLAHSEKSGVGGKRWGGQPFRYSVYRYLRDHNSSFSGLAAEATLQAREQRPHESIETPATAHMVSGNFFQVLGVHTFAGRPFADTDDVRSAASHVAVASYRFASRRYPQPEDALGKTIYLSSVPIVIVGAMSPGFFGLEKGSDPDLYVPLGSVPELARGVHFDDGAYVKPVGRLVPGMRLRQAQSDLQVLWSQLMAVPVRPSEDRGCGAIGSNCADSRIECESGARGFTGAGEEQQRSLRVLSAIVAVLLLIGCANVACLLVARGAARQHETAIRLSLGAGRGRILRQSFVESCVLALAGGAGALAIAQIGCRLLIAAFHWQQRPIEIAPDARVLVFALTVSTLTAILFGVAPALQLLRGGRMALTQEYSVAPFSSGKVLVSIEVGLSLVLLAGAAVFVRSFQNLRSLPVGFTPHDVSVIRLLPVYDDENKAPLRDAMTLLDSLRGSAEIQSATFADFVVFNDGWVSSTVRSVGDPKVFPMRWLKVAPGYWDTLRIPLLAGRDLSAQDDEHAPRVAVLNESMASKLFPHQNPIGKHLLIGLATRQPKPGDETEVVGLVKDNKFANVTAPAPDLVYQSILQGQLFDRGVALQVRSSLEPSAVGALVGARIRNGHLALKPAQPLALEDEIGASMRNDYIRMRASTLFGGLALALIAFGLYGLMAYTVARRTREIGIRTAVGASTTRIMMLVLGQSFRLIAVGIAIGIPGAVAVLRAVSGMVFGVPPVDIVSLGAAATLLAIAGTAASFVPAWRAAHLDPTQALRNQ